MNDIQRLKKLGLKEYRVEMGFFDFTVLLLTGEYMKAVEFVAWKYDEGENFIEEHKVDNGNVRGKCFYRHCYVPCIYIPRKPKTAREYATLGHECNHAIYRLFAWAGIPMGSDTEEVFTHAQAHLVNGFLEQMK